MPVSERQERDKRGDSVQVAVGGEEKEAPQLTRYFTSLGAGMYDVSRCCLTEWVRAVQQCSAVQSEGESQPSRQGKGGCWVGCRYGYLQSIRWNCGTNIGHAERSSHGREGPRAA